MHADHFAAHAAQRAPLGLGAEAAAVDHAFGLAGRAGSEISRCARRVPVQRGRFGCACSVASSAASSARLSSWPSSGRNSALREAPPQRGFQRRDGRRRRACCIGGQFGHPLRRCAPARGASRAASAASCRCHSTSVPSRWKNTGLRAAAISVGPARRARDAPCARPTAAPRPIRPAARASPRPRVRRRPRPAGHRLRYRSILQPARASASASSRPMSPAPRTAAERKGKSCDGLIAGSA